MAHVTMLGLVLVSLALTTVSRACNYTDDANSPFYWKGEENICTDSICSQYPDLNCDMTQDEIHDQVIMHTEDNITTEVKYLQEYFDTLVPTPAYPIDYTCKGVCEKPLEPIKRVFTDINVIDQYTNRMVKKRWMCHVIGPQIYRRKCGGKCDMLYGTPINEYCVTDSRVTVDVWVYCQHLKKGCRKIKIDVPISCSCKTFVCNGDARPPAPTQEPRLPNWEHIGIVFQQQPKPVIALPPKDVNLGLFGLSSQVVP